MEGPEKLLFGLKDTDSEFTTTLQEALRIFEKNVVGPGAYTQEYQAYNYILDGSAKKAIRSLFLIQPLPTLKVIYFFLFFFLVTFAAY